MQRNIEELLGRLRELEQEIEAELQRRSHQLGVEWNGRRVRFSAELRQEHRKLRSALLPYLLGMDWRSLVAALVMYPMIVPIALCDFGVSLYQAICFPLFGIPRVKRSDHFVYDRGLLAYLNAVEKLNCLYCSYANGMASYIREIFARTEQYWCPIKHARRTAAQHGLNAEFLDYGDAAAWQAQLQQLRERLRQLEQSPPT